MKTNRAAWKLSSITMGASLLVSLAGAAVAMQSTQPAAEEKKQDAVQEQDILIFHNGRVEKGTIVEETATIIKFKGKVGAIEFTTEFPKREILEIKRATKKPEGEAPKAEATTPTGDPKLVKPAATGDGAAKDRVYVINLKGVFGRDISQTPIRQALADAQRQNATHVIIAVENDWSEQNGLGEKLDAETAFDELFRAEDMDEIFTREIVNDWANPPKVVFWVKKAMGGAAFLPLICDTIYFSAEGKMGGVGYLTLLLEGVGDKVFQQKQYSLRLGHAEGMAAKGGYPYEIVRAMCVPEYILSVRYDGGKPVYLERMPDGSQGEILLSDDGGLKGPRGEDPTGLPDLVSAVVKNEGNDNLTLDARIASDLGVSKGTVDTLEELLTELGISRNAEVIKSRSDQIMQQWSKGFQEALANIRKLQRDIADIPIQGEYRDRTAARGRIKAIYRQIQGLFRKYGEIFGEETMLQQISRIQTRIDALDIDQQQDNNDQRRR